MTLKLNEVNHLIVFAVSSEMLRACDSTIITTSKYLGDLADLKTVYRTSWNPAVGLYCAQCDVLRTVALANGLNPLDGELAHSEFVLWKIRVLVGAPPITRHEIFWRAQLPPGEPSEPRRTRAVDQPVES